MGALASAPPCFKRLVQHDTAAIKARSDVLDVPLLLREGYRPPKAVVLARHRLLCLQLPTRPSGGLSGEDASVLRWTSRRLGSSGIQVRAYKDQAGYDLSVRGLVSFEPRTLQGTLLWSGRTRGSPEFPQAAKAHTQRGQRVRP